MGNIAQRCARARANARARCAEAPRGSRRGALRVSARRGVARSPGRGGGRPVAVAATLAIATTPATIAARAQHRRRQRAEFCPDVGRVRPTLDRLRPHVDTLGRPDVPHVSMSALDQLISTSYLSGGGVGAARRSRPSELLMSRAGMQGPEPLAPEMVVAKEAKSAPTANRIYSAVNALPVLEMLPGRRRGEPLRLPPGCKHTRHRTWAMLTRCRLRSSLERAGAAWAPEVGGPWGPFSNLRLRRCEPWTALGPRRSSPRGPCRRETRLLRRLGARPQRAREDAFGRGGDPPGGGPRRARARAPQRCLPVTNAKGTGRAAAGRGRLFEVAGAGNCPAQSLRGAVAVYRP